MTRHLLFVDHRDSFSGNLVALLRAQGFVVRVLDDSCLPRSTAALAAILRRADGLVLSPGPGHPRDYHLSRECYFLARERMPVLGVCLGLQIVLAAHGGRIARVMEVPVHGRRSVLDPLQASRWLDGSYCDAPWVFFNSLGCRIQDPPFLSGEWRCVAGCDGHVAWAEHARFSTLVTQFHLESFGSPLGTRFIAEWGKCMFP